MLARLSGTLPPVGSELYEEARAWLLNQFAARMLSLDARARRALVAIGEKRASIPAPALARAVQVMQRTQVRVSQPAGGHSTVSDMLGGAVEPSVGVGVTHVVVSQPAGGHSTAAGLLYPGTGPNMGELLELESMLATTSVVVTQPAGGFSVAEDLL